MKYSLIALGCTTIFASGSTLMINVQNSFAGATNPFLDENGAILTTGDLVTFGYFELDMAPTVEGDSFASFVPIDAVIISLGADGGFMSSIELDSNTDLPETTSTTLQYGIRFYNDTSVNDSTFFNTITNENWRFAFSSATPPPLPSEIFLDPILGTNPLATAIWEDPDSIFTTSIAIPEPSTTFTFLLGAGLFLGARRRS